MQMNANLQVSGFSKRSQAASTDGASWSTYELAKKTKTNVACYSLAVSRCHHVCDY